MFWPIVILILTQIVTGMGATPDQWRSRTIYQLLTDRFAVTGGGNPGCDLSNYCGGSFRGITEKLSYIKGMGFDAIWISPVVKNTPGGYHGFWAQDLFSINDHFGSASDLKNLVQAAHSQGMYVMAGVVANHMGPVGYDYSSLVPFNQQAHYHSCDNCPSGCNINFNNNNQWQVENCRLSGLPDLAQENSFVRSTLLSWVNNLISTYGFDGLRIDTVPEVPKDFWSDFQRSAGIFTIGEVFDGRVDYVAPYQKVLTSVLSYPMFFSVRNVFAYKQSMTQIPSREQEYQQKMPNRTLLGAFVDNHDNARFLNQQGDIWLYKNALTYSLSAPGVPIVYYGTEQGYAGGNDPNNREPLWGSGYNTNSDMYKFVQTLVNFRKQSGISSLDQQSKSVDDQVYSFTRGSAALVIVTNVGGGTDRTTRTISGLGNFRNGQKLCNIFWPTVDCVTVNSGSVSVTLLHGEPKVYVPSN